MVKTIACILLSLAAFLFPLKADAENYRAGTVGWYMTQLDRNAKDMLMVGIIKGMRFSEYYHQFALKEQGGKCPAKMPKYPQRSDYANILAHAEIYMNSNKGIWSSKLVEDVVALIFVRLQ